MHDSSGLNTRGVASNFSYTAVCRDLTLAALGEKADLSDGVWGKGTALRYRQNLRAPKIRILRLPLAPESILQLNSNFALNQSSCTHHMMFK